MQIFLPLNSLPSASISMRIVFALYGVFAYQRCYLSDVETSFHFHLLCSYSHDFFSALSIRGADIEDTIESARSHQSGVLFNKSSVVILFIDEGNNPYN